MKEQTALDTIKPQLMAFLNDHQLMSLATHSGQELWIANVYYACDDDLNFYFVSIRESIHSQHILENSQVAIAINVSQQTPQKMKKFNKCGVQISGQAHVLENSAEIEKGLALWKKALDITSSEYFSAERIQSNTIPQRVWKIVPRKLRFFNEALFEEGAVPLFILK